MRPCARDVIVHSEWLNPLLVASFFNIYLPDGLIVSGGLRSCMTMSVSLSVYAYVSLWVSVCTCAFLHMSLCVCVHMSMSVCVSGYMYVFINLCVYMYVMSVCLHQRIYNYI